VSERCVQQVMGRIFVGKQRWSLAEMTFLHSIFHLKVNLQATGDMTNEVFP
jgi:hypothetical protein